MCKNLCLCWFGYISKLRGRSMERNSSANVRTDFKELRSSFMVSTRAFGVFSNICAFAFKAASMFLAAIIMWAPRSASTLVVSRPIPLAPPVSNKKIAGYHDL